MLRSLGIRSRLMLVITVPLVMLVVLVLAYSTVGLRRDAKAALEKDVGSILLALDQDFERLLLLKEQRIAADLVVRLQSFEMIAAVIIYKPDGEVAFYYGKSHANRLDVDHWDGDGSRFHAGHLDMRIPLGSIKRPYGSVLAQVSTEVLTENAARSFRTGVAASFMCLIVGVGIAFLLQASISSPILKMARFVRGFSNEGDFAARLQPETGKEMVILSEGINRLLDCIQDRESDLRSAVEQAVGASRAKGDFLANMSHEIRTPMNAIVGVAPMLLETDLTEEQEDFVNMIRTSGLNLLTVINDILDFSKFEAGKMDLEQRDFDLRETIEGAVGVLAMGAEESQIDLCVQVAPDVPEILHSDSSRLRQVLVNLLGNAVKFTVDGGVLARVFTQAGKDGARQLRFEIQDTGIGISAEAGAQLFTPFAQADSSTTRLFGGTGLGLSICRGIVEVMQGEIGVDSVEGEGSTFWFTLPFSQDHSSPPVQGNAWLRGRRILCLDCSPFVRSTIRQILEAGGAHVADVAGGGGALSEGPYDLLVVNHDWGDADELKALVSRYAKLRPPALVLIGPSSERAQPESLHCASPVAWLKRPIMETRLLKVVRTVLGHSFKPTRKRAPAASAPQVNLNLDVLLAEDNTMNQRVAIYLLEKIGCRVRIANNGLEAIQALREHQVDFIFMDCQMPEMDGYTATREIRASEAPGEHIPIVALTAHAMGSELAKCTEAGMDGHLSKPINLASLQGVLIQYGRISRKSA